MAFLVGTDGSPKSDTAVEYAAETAALWNESLAIVHVLTPETILVDGTIVLPGEKEALDWGEETLERACTIAEREADSIDVQTELLTGRPADTITEYAQSIDATGIIVGHRGESVDYDRVGSVAKNTVDKAAVPVTIVK